MRFSVWSVFACSCLPSIALAQVPPQNSAGSAESIVKSVQLKLMEASKRVRLLAGRLYKISGTNEQTYIADVNDKGELDQPYECARGDRLLGVPSGPLYTGSYRNKPCKNAVEFEYQSTLTVHLETAKEKDAASFGSYLQAYSDLNAVYADAAAKTTDLGKKQEYESKSRATETAMLVAAARTLGDEKLDTLVTRDPAQSYRLVLSTAGVEELKKLQQDKELPQSGQLDFATLKVLAAKGVPKSMTTSSGDFLVLPHGWLNDSVVKASPRKSIGLVELRAAYPSPDSK